MICICDFVPIAADPTLPSCLHDDAPFQEAAPANVCRASIKRTVYVLAVHGANASILTDLDLTTCFVCGMGHEYHIGCNGTHIACTSVVQFCGAILWYNYVVQFCGAILWCNSVVQFWGVGVGVGVVGRGCGLLSLWTCLWLTRNTPTDGALQLWEEMLAADCDTPSTVTKPSGGEKKKPAADCDTPSTPTKASRGAKKDSPKKSPVKNRK